MENCPLRLSRLVATLGVSLWLMAGALATEDPQFLFLIDHSPDMAHRQLATVETVYDLVRTGFQDRIQTGEHFALWFYGSTVQTNALFTWDPARSIELARSAANLFTGRIYTRLRPREQTLRDAAPFLATSPKLTIFIITDGFQPLAGTPFDAGINAAMNARRDLFMRAAKPFVITLIAKNGQWIAGNVHTNLNEAFQIPDLVPKSVLIDAALAAVRTANPPPQRSATDPNEIDKARAALRDALAGITKPVIPPIEIKTVAALPPPEKPKEEAKGPPKEEPAKAIEIIPEPQPVQVEKPVEPKPIALEEPKLLAQAPPAEPVPPPLAAIEPPNPLAAVPIETATEPQPKLEQIPTAIQTAAITPSRRGFPWPVLTLVIFAIVLGGFVALMRVKSRAKSPGSLISQSLPPPGNSRFK